MDLTKRHPQIAVLCNGEGFQDGQAFRNVVNGDLFVGGFLGICFSEEGVFQHAAGPGTKLLGRGGKLKQRETVGREGDGSGFVGALQEFGTVVRDMTDFHFLPVLDFRQIHRDGNLRFGIGLDFFSVRCYKGDIQCFLVQDDFRCLCPFLPFGEGRDQSIGFFSCRLLLYRQGLPSQEFHGCGVFGR